MPPPSGAAPRARLADGGREGLDSEPAPEGVVDLHSEGSALSQADRPRRAGRRRSIHVAQGHLGQPGTRPTGCEPGSRESCRRRRASPYPPPWPGVFVRAYTRVPSRAGRHSASSGRSSGNNNSATIISPRGSASMRPRPRSVPRAGRCRGPGRHRGPGRSWCGTGRAARGNRPSLRPGRPSIPRARSIVVRHRARRPASRPPRRPVRPSIPWMYARCGQGRAAPSDRRAEAPDRGRTRGSENGIEAQPTCSGAPNSGIGHVGDRPPAGWAADRRIRSIPVRTSRIEWETTAIAADGELAR